ncbi:unnamed protein product [Sphagnum jensenii]|uniref:RING-type E3 ubiquitin transferase n=1 Tax=Sphagnum jensenii TaxID=128206 RepID=A0ABP0X7S2_9BRYO
MSFGFRGSRGDLETGLHNLMPDRRNSSSSSSSNMRFHGTGRAFNASPMAFLVTVLLLLMIVNSQQMSPNFLLWAGMGVFLIASSLRLYAICHQLQAQAQAAAAAASTGGLVGHPELRLRMNPLLSFATRAQLQGLRLQLALLDREFDDLDYDALRALDADNPPGVSAMSDIEINRLPVRNYKAAPVLPTPHSQLRQSYGLSLYQPFVVQKSSAEGEKLRLDEELTCSICLEQVKDGELVRSLPCVHQFHSMCIDQWLKQQATCPVCKFRLGTSQPQAPNASGATYTV